MARRFAARRSMGNLGLKGDVLPQHFQHAYQTECYAVRVKVRLAAVGNEALDEQSDKICEAFIFQAADIVVFLP